MAYAIGRACLRKIGYKSRWYASCNNLYEGYSLMDLVNLVWLRHTIEINGQRRLPTGEKF